MTFTVRTLLCRPKFLTSTTDEPGKAHYGMIGYPLKNTSPTTGT